MRTLKDAGINELDTFEKRVTKALKLERINAADAKFIATRITAIRTKITSMHEVDYKGRPALNHGDPKPTVVRSKKAVASVPVKKRVVGTKRSPAKKAAKRG